MATLKTYREFSDDLFAYYRTNHPNSSTPRPHVISSLYDDYLKENGMQIEKQTTAVIAPVSSSEWLQSNNSKPGTKVREEIKAQEGSTEPKRKTIQEHKKDATLKVKVRYPEGIMTRAEWCELKKKEGATVQEVMKSKTKYNRVKYNRMGQTEQEEYERKLNTLVPCYELSEASGNCFYDITKIEYDYFNSL